MFSCPVPKFCGENTPKDIEKCFWDSLLEIRKAVSESKDIQDIFAAKLKKAQSKLNRLKREKSEADAESVYKHNPAEVPAAFTFEKGKGYATRSVLGDVLGHINKESKGAMLVGSADLYGSTNAANISKPFPQGFYKKYSNPDSKTLAMGGICEDAMNAMATGISAFGSHIGVSSSYAAFLAFGHVAMRLHAIGQETLHTATGEPFRTVIMYNGHTGIPTGEDGPTHADPQCLQLMQENFPKGTCITMTPFEIDEIWPLTAHILNKRPAVFSPFVARPSDKYIDRAALGIEPAANALNGVYALQRAEGKADCNIFIQGTGVARIFVEGVLPELKAKGIKLNVFYVTSRELFLALPKEEREKIVPEVLMKTAMGITDFTMPTMHAWLMSNDGREHSLWPHKQGKYLGSGKGGKVYEEAGLDAKGQISAILSYIDYLKTKMD
ncbi:transketolase [Parelusimicrobium proximum]|uniref:hypothetical protein n=1 Tax=Parelusimicrobium proximum TaxID=3228953 RepID=UPI003D16E84B